MRRDSDHIFTFSPGPSFQENFTPSPSESTSLFGSHYNVQTPSSVSSGAPTPGSSIFGGQNTPRRIFSFEPVAGPSAVSNLATGTPSPRSVSSHSIDGNTTEEPRAFPILTARPAGIFSNQARDTGPLFSHIGRNIVRDIPARSKVNRPEELFGSSTPPARSASIFNNQVPDIIGSMFSHEERSNDRDIPLRADMDRPKETSSSSTPPASGIAGGENDRDARSETEDEDERGDEHQANEAGEDSFTPDPVDDQSLQDNLNAIKIQLQELSRTMNASQLAQDPQARLHQIYQETKELSEFKDQQTRIVGFIGETGVGKSSVINSILDQRGLARSSGASAACTSVPIEYRYVDEAHPDAYTIDAEFMNETEVKDLLDELLRSIRRAAIPTERSIIAEENWVQYEAIGKMSHETLLSIFRDRPDLTIEYLSRPGMEDEILRELKQLAMDRLTFRPGGSSSLDYRVVAGDLETCKDELDRLTRDPEDSDAHALWPFIKLIRVFLDLPVLKTGLVLADLPGLRDMNFARVRATEKYLASTCDEVFIVAGISRCTSNPAITDTINKCGERRRIQIVCTRADQDISAEESARGDTNFANRVRIMNAEIRNLEEETTDIGRKRQRARGHRKAELAVIESTKEDKIHQLRYERQAFLMNERNNSTTRKLERAIQNKPEHMNKDIKIFCVSNELYGNPPHRLAENYRSLSGVRELRSYCRSVPAEARMLAASSFIEDQVPALLHSIEQWTLTGRDSVNFARARELRRVLERVEEDLRQDFISARGRLHRTQNEVYNTFDNQVMEQLDPYFQRELKQKFVAVGENWANTYHFTSYAAFCRKNGTHTTGAKGTQCWNDELMAQARPALGARWDAVDTWIMSQRNALHLDISTSFQTISDTIQAHFLVAPQAIGNLLSVLEYRARCIKYIFTNAITHIFQITESIRYHTLNGYNNSSLIADLMREAYNKCNRESGGGSSKRRTDIMHAHLSNIQLYRTYANSVRTSYHTAMDEPFVTLGEKLHEQIEMIARDLRAVMVPAGEVPEFERAPGLVREFQRRIQTLREVLDCASAAIQAAGITTDQ